MLAGFIVSLLSSSPVLADDIWVDVDTTEHVLLVMRGNTVQDTFDNIAIGRFGTTYFKMRNDDKTPLGRFRIGWVNNASRYYRFFGLDYPNHETAKRALDENRITVETWQSILQAIKMEKTPPQDTPLGGYIGIHGIGRGEREIHDQYNWTNGCIALTNEQIDRLSRWIKPGTMVKIR
ncbi:L,D-transpeptidase catalytic domain [Nitrosomonas cryotolerans]|uniref:L,D-transpeptidase catalytic domain n=2 Tax=Nitrosomonas cryotolerans TaxID=44575 RepID=A0A1N6J293_9PROT|nr:L,D-transpeptidase catalytic domain [Nitrosomonas cryotolerans]SIO38365.1 L,D-transpeptidase catalytic domain [Nitrosomonas cryotolerans ATCC 49181]